MADEELLAFLSYPRHKIVMSENVAQVFYDRSLRELPPQTALPTLDNQFLFGITSALTGADRTSLVRMTD